MNANNKIINELKEVGKNCSTYMYDMPCYECIAKYIIARERNIINPLVICLENSKNTPDFVKSYAFLANGIVETLKRAGLNS